MLLLALVNNQWSKAMQYRTRQDVERQIAKLFADQKAQGITIVAVNKIGRMVHVHRHLAGIALAPIVIDTVAIKQNRSN
jgi:hypothetical protein